jgi:hypothetical protein
MKKQFFALVLLVLPLIPMAKGAGYGHTEWGMRPSEVVTAQNGKAHLISPEKYPNSWGKVRIDDVNIGGSLYNVTFLFDASDHLIQTNVTSNEKKNEGIILRQFDSLHQLLTQKYGKPLFEGVNKVTWKIDDTTIELSKMVISGILAQTSVRYVPNSRVSNDTSAL